jgi:hypothetical protein
MDKEILAFLYGMTERERVYFYRRNACSVKDWRDMDPEELRVLIAPVDPSDPAVAEEYLEKYGMIPQVRNHFFAKYGFVSEEIVAEASFDGFTIYRFMGGSKAGTDFARSLKGCDESIAAIIAAKLWTGAQVFLVTDGEYFMGCCVLMVFMPPDTFGPGHAVHRYYRQTVKGTYGYFLYEQVFGGKDEPWRIGTPFETFTAGHTVDYTRLSAAALAVPREYAGLGVPDALIRTFTAYGIRAGYPECAVPLEDDEDHLKGPLRENGYIHTLDKTVGAAETMPDGTKRRKATYTVLRTPLVPGDDWHWHGELKRPLLREWERRMVSMSDSDSCREAWRFCVLKHDNQNDPATEAGWGWYARHIGAMTRELVSALEVDPELDGNMALVCAFLHDLLFWL